MVLANARTATRTAVVVRCSELTEDAAEMKPPVVLQREMKVRRVRRLQWQAARRPVLPPAVVPLKPLTEQPLVPIEEADPGAPRRLVGAAQIAEVVDLEPGRATLIRRLEHHVPPAHLAEFELLGVTIEHSAIGIEGKARVRPLVVVHAVGLLEQ